MEDDNAMRYIIPPHYTSILQPCDVGMNKPLKEWLKKWVSEWRRAQHALLSNDDKIPAPKREDVLGWLKNIWDNFPIEIVKNSFIDDKYYLEDTFDFSGETESESNTE